MRLPTLYEKVGANVDAVRIGIGSDDRIGKRFLFAGIDLWWKAVFQKMCRHWNIHPASMDMTLVFCNR